MDFQKTNNLIGWLVFCVALITYSLTVEETASYWDCSEFIATSYKLEVPHPPGAPLFLLMGRVFSFLAMGDVTKVAYAMNMMSALASAFTVLFLFWSIVLFGRKLVKASQKPVDEKKWKDAQLQEGEARAQITTGPPPRHRAMQVSARVNGRIAGGFGETFR